MNYKFFLLGLGLVTTLTFANSQIPEKLLPLPKKFVKSLEPGPGCTQSLGKNVFMTNIPDNLSKYGSGAFVNLGGKITPFSYTDNGRTISGLYEVKYKSLKTLSQDDRYGETIGQLVLLKNNKVIHTINKVKEFCSE